MQIDDQPKQAKDKLDTSKIERLDMRFGGTRLLETTIRQVFNGRDLVGQPTR